MAAKSVIKYGDDEENKDVPLSLVVMAGIAIWVLIFGSIFAYTYLSPCSFIETVVGDDTFLKFQDPRLRVPPCDPKTDINCVAWKLETNQDCLCFLGLKPIGGDCLGYFD